MIAHPCTEVGASRGKKESRGPHSLMIVEDDEVTKILCNPAFRKMSAESSERLQKTLERKRRARQPSNLKDMFRSPLAAFRPQAALPDPNLLALSYANMSAVTMAHVTTLRAAPLGEWARY